MTNTPDLASIKLPYNVKLGGGGTFLKGVPLQSLVSAIIRHASPEYQAETAWMDKIDVEAFKKAYPHFFKHKKNIPNLIINKEKLIDACLSYRHDFGLLSMDDKRKQLQIVEKVANALIKTDTILVDNFKPEPFWKPIEQCPKEGRAYYLIIVDCDIYCATWNCGWEYSNDLVVPYGDHATHFAEIPPCEVKP